MLLSIKSPVSGGLHAKLCHSIIHYVPLDFEMQSLKLQIYELTTSIFHLKSNM